MDIFGHFDNARMQGQIQADKEGIADPANSAQGCKIGHHVVSLVLSYSLAMESILCQPATT